MFKVNNCKNNNTILNTKDWIEYTQEVETTIEKQIPKKPINKAGRHTGHYLCPICNRIYWKDEILPNYCQGCGQKFDLG